MKDVCLESGRAWEALCFTVLIDMGTSTMIYTVREAVWGKRGIL